MLGMRFPGQTAVVTGAGRGMGRAVALALAKEGAAVIVAEVDRAPADQVAGEIEAAGGRARAVTVDIASVEDVRGLFKETVDAFGGLDILVNNAGIGIPKP